MEKGGRGGGGGRYGYAETTHVVSQKDPPSAHVPGQGDHVLHQQARALSAGLRGEAGRGARSSNPGSLLG